MNLFAEIVDGLKLFSQKAQFKYLTCFWIRIWSIPLTLSWRRFLLCRNKSIDLQSKSMDWFLYDRDFRRERVKPTSQMLSYETILKPLTYFLQMHLSLPTENTRKPYGFLMFSVGRERCIGSKWVNIKLHSD